MVNITSNSKMPGVLGKISKAARDASRDVTMLNRQFGLLEKRVDASRMTFDRFTRAAGASNATFRDLGATFRAAGSASSAAASGSGRAASGFNAAAAAADRAAAAVARYNVATYAGSGAGVAFARAGVRQFVGGAIAGNSAAALTSIGQAPPMRFAKPPILALPGGGGASGSPWSGGPGAPGGGGGGFGGFIPPVGGVPGWALHKAGQFAMLGAGAGAGLGIDAVHEAGRLQTILQSTRNIVGANDGQMARIRQAAFDVGDKNAMSPVQAAEMFRDISRQSVGAFGIEGMIGLLPRMAKLQTVLGAARGFSPAQTTDNVMGILHLLRAYNPKAQANVSDTVLRMGELMPDDLAKARTQMGYFAPTLKNMHVTNDDAAALMIAISRFGMGRGKGGTTIQNLFADALGPLQLTQHAQAGKAKLLGPGMLDVLDAHGNSRFFTNKSGDPMGFLSALETFATRHGSVQAQKVFEGAFGKVGSRLADLMADPVMVQQLRAIEKVLHESKTLGLDAQANTIYRTAQFAEKRAGQNFQGLLTEVGTAALPAVTKGFTDLADSLHYAQHWLNANPQFLRTVQTDFLDGVQGIENYLVQHQGDFLGFGQSLMTLGSDAVKMSPLLMRGADAIIALTQSLGPFLDMFTTVANFVNKQYTREDAIRKTLDHGLPKRIDGRLLPGSRVGLPSALLHGIQPGPTLDHLHDRAAGRPGPSWLQDPAAVRAGRPTKAGRGDTSSRTVHIGNISYHAVPGDSAAHSKQQMKQLANQVASVIADNFGLDIRSGGALPAFAGDSHHAVLAGTPS